MSCNARIASTSRLLVGSSRTRTSGSSIVAAATARRCCWPPESSAIVRSRRFSMPKRRAARAMRARISSPATPAFSHANASSSVEHAWKYWVFEFWNTLPTTRAYAPMSARPATSPAVRASPSSAPATCTGARPLSSRVTVVLPHPLRPASTTNSPRHTCASTSRNARTAVPAYPNVHPRSAHIAASATRSPRSSVIVVPPSSVDWSVDCRRRSSSIRRLCSRQQLSGNRRAPCAAARRVTRTRCLRTRVRQARRAPPNRTRACARCAYSSAARMCRALL